MHCKICDADSDSVTMVDDCSTCQQAIFECLAGYPDPEINEHVIDEGYDDTTSAAVVTSDGATKQDD